MAFGEEEESVLKDCGRVRPTAGKPGGCTHGIDPLMPYFGGGLRLLLPSARPDLLLPYPYDEGYYYYGHSWVTLPSLLLWFAASGFLWVVWINRANSAKNRVL